MLLYLIFLSLCDYTKDVYGKEQGLTEYAPDRPVSVQEKALQTESSGDMVPLDCSARKQRLHAGTSAS